MEKSKLNIAIIDYGLGNLFSVKQACIHFGVNPIVTNDKNKVLKSDGVILPGVGAFGFAMENLKKLDLIEPIKQFAKEGKYFLGICLGMQLIFEQSEEFGSHQGLGLVKGKVVKFPKVNDLEEPLRIPNIGWNQIYRYSEENWNKSPLKTVKGNEFMYFVHSFYCCPEDKSITTSLANYERIEYVASVKQNNVSAFQFHPEKSGVEGIKIYDNWFDMILRGE